MASLGKLTADLALDIAQFVAPLNKAEQELVDFHQKVQHGFDAMVEGVTEKLGELAGAYLAVEKVLEALASSMEWSEKLKTMSDQTGIGVQALDQLALTAKLGGVELDTLGQSMSKLAKNMVTATDPSTKLAGTFDALGVKVENADGSMRSTADVFKDAGAAIAAIQDPALQSAAAVAVFGRGGAALIPMFKEMDENAALAQEAIDAFGKATDEQVNSAKSLTDTFALMKTGVDRLVAPIITALAPAFRQILKAFEDMMQGSGPLMDFLGTALVGAVKLAASGLIILVQGAEKVVRVFQGLAEASGAALHGDWAALGGIASSTFADIDKISEQSAKALSDVWAPAADKAGEAAGRAAPNAAQLKANLSGAGAEAAKAGAALDKLAQKYLDMLASQGEGGGAQLAPQTAKELGELDTLLDKGKLSWDQYAAALDLVIGKDPVLTQQQKDLDKVTAMLSDSLHELSAGTVSQLQWLDKMKDTGIVTTWEQYDKILQRILDKDPELIKQQKAINDAAAQWGKVLEDINTITQKWQQQDDDLVRSIAKGTEALQDSTNAIGLEGLALQLANNERERKLQLEAAIGPVAKQAVQTEYDMRAAILAEADARTAAVTVMKSALDWGEKFFESMSDGLGGIKKWAQDAGAALKKYLLDILFEATVKPFVVSLIAGFMPTSATAASASAAGGGAGSPLGTLTSLFGGAGGGNAITSAIGTAIGGSFSEFASLGFSGGVSALGVAATEGAAAIGGMTSVLGAVAATLPVVGAVAAIGFALYTAFANKGGGPKSGGFAESGAVSGRYFTPADSDATAKTVTDSVQAAYTAAIKGFGANLEDAAFAIGFDTDPKGTAMSHVRAGATVGGVAVYDTGDVAVGRDDASLQAGMATAAKRALLAALQASDLPPAITRILDTVDALTATDDAVQSVIDLATAFGALSKTIDGMSDPMKDAQKLIDANSKTAMGAWNDQRAAVRALADSTAPTVDGMNALNTANQALYTSTVQLLAGILQLKQSIHDTFEASKDAITTSLMTPQELYTFYDQQNKALYAQLATATDPADINRISTQLNTNLGKMWDLFMQSPDFAGMTPEQQHAAQKNFLDDLTAVETLATKRLTDAADQVGKDAETDRQYMSTKLDEILAKITDAGTQFTQGANTISATAAKGINVNIAVDDSRTSVEVNG